jgi:CRP-like cAMP-binding protein
LFAGIDADELDAMFVCLSPRKKSFAKGEYVYVENDDAAAVGVVVSGNVDIIREDYWGNRSIITRAGSGELFAEAFSCAARPCNAESRTLPVSVVANEECEILLLDYRRILLTCSSACGFHTRLIENMLRVIAGKNISLISKLQHLTQRNTREKLLSYLSEQAVRSGANKFDIPFNRQELADFLSVERSAMSAELSRLKAEGLLYYRKNHFELYCETSTRKAAFT